MAKKFNFTTITEMKTDKLLRAILFLIGGLVLISVGAMIASKEGANWIVIAIGAAVAGAGAWFGVYGAYQMVIDPKNAKTCNVNFWNKYECVANPAGTDAEYELDITECKAQTDAEYKGYAGVWLRSNSTNTSNVDAFYIPGDKTSLTLTSDPSKNTGGTLFAKKGDGKDDKGVTVTGATSGCTKSLGTITASSPSASGVTLKLSGVSGFSDSDSVTLTIRSTASPPPSSSSPIVTSSTITTLKTGYTVTGQSMTPGTYSVSASATGATAVSATFTVA